MDINVVLEAIAKYLVLKPFESCPAAHDELIVGGKDDDIVHALCLELLVLLEEGREMLRVASGLPQSDSLGRSRR
jgi:hypothetical protein